MVLRCDLCRVEVPDERVLADHQSGKRHQALLNARERFEASQNSSIYVTRIKPAHDESILRDYFARFGTIKNCFLDKEKHVYAIVEYDAVDAANKCLEQAEQCVLDDGTRLKIKPRNHHEFKSKRMLVSEQEFLNINKEKEIEQHAALIQALNSKSTVDEQAEAIVQQEKIPDDVLKTREEFYKELETMFAKHFPGAKLSLIGSMANGLATALSDLDLVLVLNDTYIEPQRVLSSNTSGESMTIDENSCSADVDMQQQKQFKRNASDGSSSRSLSPPLPTTSPTAEELLQMTVPDRLEHIRRLLRSSAAYVCHVQRIAQARCPVVRFCHKQQKIFCELSVNNHLAIANTELVRYMLAVAPKLRPLLYTIRLWAKQKDLLGRGQRFNTYTLFWMIVCSLQLDGNQLPSARSLADRAGRKRQHGPWDCSIPEVDQMERKMNNTPTEQLLQHFFKFYSTLDATQHELSPWTGKLEPKKSAGNPFSISDPFEHDHNLTSNISSSNWLKFQEECALVNQILDESSKKRQNKSWGLSLILTRKSLPQKNFAHEPQYHHSRLADTIEFDVHGMTEQELEGKVNAIFKEVLLFEPINYEVISKKRPASPPSEVTPNKLAEQLDETLSSKRRRMDEDGSSSTPATSISYSKEKHYFQVSYRTWQDRRKLKRSTDDEHQGLSVLDREQLISKKLKEDAQHHLEAPVYLSMQAKLLPASADRKAQVHLEFQGNAQHQFFVDLTHFLTLYLPKMLTNQPIH